MADVALGGVGKIVEIALKIKEAVKTVKQNQKECQDIQRCVARVSALIKRLDEVTTETMNDVVMRDALEDLAESLQGALELVTKCQRKNIVLRFIGAGDMAKELRQVQDDIVRKLTIGTFATNVLHISITLATISQVLCMHHLVLLN
jgi:L1 cell adhesion molecule like protein